nr:hypothetical protein BaRGS_004740 [Batillaria attramentaria]
MGALRSGEKERESYPVIEQKGLYSSMVCTGVEEVIMTKENQFVRSDLTIASAKVLIGLSPRAWCGLRKSAVFMNTFGVGKQFGADELKKQVTAVSQKAPTDFLQKAFIPKIQIAWKTKPGECPRKLAVESPSEDAPGLCWPHFLPLYLFDNEEYDSRLPMEWLDLGWDEETQTMLPVPAQALIGSRDEDFNKDPTDPSIEYKWCSVGVLAYWPEEKLWLVHRCNEENRVLDDKGQPVRNGGVFRWSGERHMQRSEVWVPRIRVMFKAESAEMFAKRLGEAYDRRTAAEKEIRYNLYVDCMPIDGIEDLDEAAWKRMEKKTLSTPGIRRHGEMVDAMMKRMEEEVKLDYKRSMNRQTFDMVLDKHPEEFTYVAKPSRPEKPVPQSARYHEVPEYSFENLRARMMFRYTLTPHAETVCTMVRIRHECNRVAFNMSLFVLPTPKPMKIEDFEQSQLNASTQASLFLRDSWIQSIRTHIKSSMLMVGKGWYDITQPVYYIYQQSQFKYFMDIVKYMMQDSLRFLTQDSLHTYTQLVVDACHTLISVDDEFRWGNNLLNSSFRPKRIPLFVMELTMDQHTVGFNTKLEKFEDVLISLFDKAIMATHNVPQIEKFVMENIRWWGTPLLEAVGKYEPPIVDLRETIRRMIRKSLIPTLAYAREYERFRELFNMDIKAHIEVFKSKPHNAEDVRKLAQESKDDEEAIYSQLPAVIVIGPFQISTDNVKQNLLKKRHAVSLAYLELLASELREQADEASDTMKTVSRRLFDKPPCIEEVEVMDRLKLDYEVLDDFQFSLSNDDFTIKWEALAWPYKIDQLVEKTLTVLDEDEERYRKLQEHDHSAFEERLSNLMIQVAGMQNYDDIKKGHEYANEMRRVNKAIRECQAMAITYNARERIFNMPVTNYDRINKMMKEFEPFRNLWVGTSDWLRWYDGWMHDPLTNINPEDVERNVNEAYKIMHKSVKIFHEHPAVQAIASEIKGLIEDFKPYIPLIQGLRNPGMRDRHWTMISQATGIQVKPKANLTFSKCLEMGLHDHIEIISSTADVAGKEYAIETALDKMEREWENVYFDVQPYKNTGTYIQKTSDETGQLLDDHIVMTQSMSFSPYKASFEARLTKWENTLRTTQDVIDEWTTCQRSWMYLEPIFSSDDITRQLPVESKRYQTMERIWHKVMKKAYKEPKLDNNLLLPQVIELCPDQGLLKNLCECNELLEQVQKGLSEYLETKRNSFPRFYFLSDDELLEILSQTRDPTAVQPHLRKCFENVYRLQFESDLKITKLFSAEGEVVDMRETLYPTGNVEDWMSEIERIMRESVRQIIKEALKDYLQKPRTRWVLDWPGQVVIAGCQTYWSAEVAEAIESQTLKERFDILLEQLDDLRNLVRQKLTSIGRMTLSALIVIEVHARDVVATIVKENVTNSNAFEWIAQLRYYWMEDQNLYQRAVNAQFPYGYEYLGNTLRLVITPLTDRCYLTLTGALHLKFGGAPAGPAGTGKTETTKDLGKAFAIQCVVFNCSDQLDVMAMGKFFKGLASAGAWACFDEFNRIDIEVLSVVAQQAERFIFEGVELRLRMSCAVFITMNPGYAGRTELPDNLKDKDL